MNNGSRIFVSGGIRNADMDVSKDDPIRRRLCFINLRWFVFIQSCFY